MLLVINHIKSYLVSHFDTSLCPHAVLNLKSKLYSLLFVIFLSFVAIESLLAADPTESEAFESSQEEIKEFLEQSDSGTSWSPSREFIEKNIRRAEQGNDNNDTFAIMMDMFGSSLSRNGEFELAERALKAGLAIRRTIEKPSAPSIAVALNKLGWHYYFSGELELAEITLEQARLFYEENDFVTQHTVDVHLNLAEVKLRLKDPGAAQKQLRSAEFYINLLEENSITVDKSYFARGDTINGNIMYAIGELGYAENHYKKGIETYEQVVGKNPFAGPLKILGTNEFILTLSQLGRCLTDQQRYTEAEKYLLRAIGLSRQHMVSTNPYVREIATNMAYYLEKKGELDEALQIHGEIFTLLSRTREYTNPDQNENFAPIYLNLGRLYTQKGEFDKADQLFNGALITYRIHHGRDSFSYAQTLKLIGVVYNQRKEYEMALALLGAARTILEKSDALGGQLGWEISLEFAQLYENMGQINRALKIYRDLSKRIQSENISSQYKTIFRLTDETLFRYIDVLQRMVKKDKTNENKYMAESLQAKQILRYGAGQLIEDMQLRSQKIRDPKNDTALNKWRETREKMLYTQASLESTLIKPVKYRNDELENSLRKELKKLTLKEGQLRKTLLKSTSKTSGLAAGNFTEISALQKLLPADEAILSYLFSDKTGFVWIIRNNKTILIPLKTGQIELSRAVRELRRGLDQGDVREKKNLRPFDINKSWDLYKKVFLPVVDHLDGVSRIRLIADGALEQIPIGVLVSSTAGITKENGNDYSRAQWLANKYAFSLYPSESTLYWLNKEKIQTKATKPFIGLGHPKFSKSEKIKAANFSSLPETVVELTATADALGAGIDFVLTQDKASENWVKSSNLKDYRVISFATHALLREEAELLGISVEPGILLAAGTTGDNADDGYLTASEIAGLDLDATLVILSGCNTGTISNIGGARGLTGMTKAFNLAGARAIMASHWTVFSQSTAYLVSRMFTIKSDIPGIGYDQALQKINIEMIKDESGKGFSHPVFWAPFMIIGTPDTTLTGSS